MIKAETIEIGPDDVSDEEIILEWDSRPAGQPPLCPRDGHPMTRQQQTYALAGGRFAVTYEAWVCSRCGREFLNRQQSRRFGALQMLDRLLRERKDLPKSQVLFDGQDLFVNLSLVQDMTALWRPAAAGQGA